MTIKPVLVFAVVRKADGYVTQRTEAYSAKEITVDSKHEVIEMVELLPPGSIRYDRAQNKFVPLTVRPSMYHYWENGVWIDYATQEERWAQARQARNALLAATDWAVIESLERGGNVPQNIKAYRQALRDLTKQRDPYKITWPTPPASVARSVGVNSTPTSEI